ncbi:MAG: hypothetical protein JXR69_08395 [Candidatus Delongbacteria bacterium]|nr:hypothetical protein [Candidatus Delongbacteria bacterium]
MEKTIASLIIGSAMIWGATILAVSFKLKGMEIKPDVIQVIGLAAGMHLILIWGPAGAMIRKMKLKELKKDKEKEGNDEGY